jgi:GNAT superfamily N-acetyltransferase
VEDLDDPHDGSSYGRVLRGFGVIDGTPPSVTRPVPGPGGRESRIVSASGSVGPAPGRSIGPTDAGLTEPLSIGPLLETEEIDRPVVGDLSDWFNPFLPHFLREVLRAHGEVLVARSGREALGVLLVDPIERTGSLFARHPGAAARLFRERRPLSIFSELTFEAPREPYEIFNGTPGDVGATARFAHPVRLANATDGPELGHLMSEVYGATNPEWLAPDPAGVERCFVAESEGRLVGAAWIAIVGAHGRLHSVSVAPRFRGLGIGASLWNARMLYAERQGVRNVLAEIAPRNAPSRAIALKGGMRPVGVTYLYECP